MMAETDSRVTNLFTKKSHHSDTSVIYLVQNLLSKNRESSTISLNAQYMIVFKNPRDASQLAVAVKKEAAATMTMPTTASVVEPTDIVGTLPKTLQMK